VVSHGYEQRIIPLASVRGLGEAVMNWWMSPAGHRSARVEFDEAGQRKCFSFLPGTALFRTVSDSRTHSAEWMLAIQRAVKSATGRELDINQTPTVLRVESALKWIWLVLPVFFCGLLIIKLTSTPVGSGNSLMGILALLWPLLILLPILAWRSASIRGRNHASLSPGSSGVESAETESDLIQASQSRLTSAATNQESRFSRTAIVGAGWGILCVTVCLVAISLQNVGRGMVLHELFAQIAGVMVGFLLIIVAAAPFVTTILGWIAVTQIHRSAGKLHGLWLAVFDGLFFPLLALDALILGTPLAAFKLGLVQWIGIKASKPLLLLASCATLAIVVVADVFIIRRVWRAVKAPADSTASQKTASAQDIFLQPFEQVFGPRQPGHFWRWFALALVLVPLGLILLMVFLGTISHSTVPRQNPPPHLVFGPEIERVVPEPKAGLGCVLNFETGELLTPPENISMHLLSEGVGYDIEPMNWARKYGGDLLAMPDGGVRFLDGVVSRQTNEEHLMTWDEFTPGQVVSEMRQLLKNPASKQAWPQFYSVSDRAPLAIAFVTRQHSMGLLQILGNSENPRSVKLRYKLV